MASFSVVTNIASSNAQANLYTTNIALNKTLTRVSSGLRINSSGDDAAGLAVANSFRSRVAVLNQGVRNGNDALSDLQIKDGALNNVSKLLDRMATLATQAATSSTTPASRTTLNAEFQDILAEITRELNVAGLTATATFSVFMSGDGADGVVNGTINATNTGTAVGGLFEGLATPLAVDTAVNAQGVVGALTTAVARLGSVQGQVGTLQNRISYAISLAQSQIVNTQAAESRIRDANMAEEAANLTRYNILNQSGLAALAQSNQSSAAVLALFQ